MITKNSPREMTEPYILIVDDDPNTCQLIQIQLSKLYWKSVSVNHGHDALEMVEERLPSLIFLDLMMPEVNGFDILSQIKQDEQARNIPIVIVSGLGDPDMVRQLKVTAVLQKGTMAPTDIRNIVQSHLS